MTPDDLDRRFAFHASSRHDKAEAHSDVRSACRELAELLNRVLPEGREKSIAVTRLEEVMFWSNAAIARDGATSAS
ncbi:hypothetical protein [Streptomyces sp. CAU 1734]|uniref:Acb2/Tad1 domain-containing protein n=1 Tax=Streptomyces sp. CAU 1734 TaxID=3140360 RepID=UPI003261686C